MENDEGFTVEPGSTAANQEAIAREIEYLRARLAELEKRISPALREKVPTGKLAILVARVAEDSIAFLHHGIEEIVPMARLTAVPESAEWVAGILNLREKMVVVIDVRARLRKKARRPELSDLILICRVEERVVGLIVQEVLEFKTVSSNEIEDAPTDVPFAPHVMGALQSAGRPVLLLSVKTLIATSDIPSSGL